VFTDADKHVKWFVWAGEEPPAPGIAFISAFLPTIASGLFRFPLMLQKAALSVDDPIP
jgi:hypothetical protein